MWLRYVYVKFIFRAGAVAVNTQQLDPDAKFCVDGHGPLVGRHFTIWRRSHTALSMWMG
jgi:hypothetical protein